MAIDFSLYNPITSTVTSTISGAKNFAGLALTNNLLIPSTTPIVKLTSLAAVGAYFGESSNEYAGARRYFAAYDTALATPPYIYFGSYLSDDRSPFLRSSVVANPTTKLAALKAITAGVITVVVDTISYTSTGINLSSATSLNQIGILVTEALVADHAILGTKTFDIGYNGPNNYFVASIGAGGSTETMDYFSSTTTSLATLMQMTAATSAILSQGQDQQTVAENLDRLLPFFTDQFSIFFTDKMSGAITDVEMVELAQWVSDQGDRFQSIPWSNLPAMESSTDTTSIKYLIDQAGINNASCFDEVLLNNAERAFAYAGVFASLDLTQPNSAMTPAFKQQTGLAPSVTSTAIASILDDKQINYYGQITVNGSAILENFFYGGYTSGKWEYTDNLVAQVWIAYQCQIAILRLLTTFGQVVNDPDGYGLVRSSLTDAITTAITNGMIATGVVFDNTTAQNIKSLYGIDATQLTRNGYAIINRVATPDQRKNRESPDWIVLYVKGSAIQEVPVHTVTYF